MQRQPRKRPGRAYFWGKIFAIIAWYGNFWKYPQKSGRICRIKGPKSAADFKALSCKERGVLQPNASALQHAMLHRIAGQTGGRGNA